MDQCCPSPDYPIIQPDQRALNLRVFLKILYWGQALICILKFLLFGSLAGLFQLVNLWVIYTAFATMHFCSVLIYLIMCIFDLMFIFLDWKRIMQLTDNKSSPLLISIFIVMGIYYVLAIFYSYRAYNHYKTLFFQQLGDVYRMHPESDFQHNDAEAAYHEQQRQLREQFFSQQAAQQRLRQQQESGPRDGNNREQNSNANVGKQHVPEQVSHMQQHQQESSSVPPPAYVPPPSGQQQPRAPILVHDFTRNDQNNNRGNNNNGGFVAFQGKGHSLQ